MKADNPCYFHREYTHDLESKKSDARTWVENSKRFALVALPFFSLYKPCGRPLSIALGAVRALTFCRNGDVKHASIATVSVAASLFAHPLGMLISTVQDIALTSATLADHIQAGRQKEALESCATLANNALYLALFFGGGPHAAIASLAMQVFIGIYHARREYKEDNLLEAAGHLAMSMIRSQELMREVYILRMPRIERRAVIDIGSGSTKLCIADVDTKTNHVVRVILQESYAVPYQAAMEGSEDHSFTPEIKDLGLRTFEKIERICAENGVNKTAAIATEAFRKSMNAESFVGQIQNKTRIQVRIISQKEEGLIAYYSAAQLKKDIPSKNLVVWDIGTGSFQLTTEGNVFMGDTGSVPFRHYVKEVVQDKDINSSVYPFSENDRFEADRYARALARKASFFLKQRIREEDCAVIGIGRLFNNSLKPMGTEAKISRSDLRNYIRDQYRIEPKDDPFAEADLCNAILVHGFMKSLHIKEVSCLESTTSQGVLNYAPYWA